GGTIYQWEGPDNFTVNTNSLSIPNIGFHQEGTYYVTVSNGSCSSTSSVYVDVIPLPVISVVGDTFILIGNSTQLIASGADTYEWIPSTDLSCSKCNNPIASPLVSTEYCVVGTQNGCRDSVCIEIVVDQNCGELFVPEAFSPNGDGRHDRWGIRGRCIKEIELVIFDRWGEKIFETFDPSEEWDGTYKGKPLDTDVYVFFARVVLLTGEEKRFKGDITLIR
ncbi:MAG: gliding motility-associated C-terminal domain-containing protein, partial [Bacteroidales bacterium]|nr:gliding motility-associated C-terminal domain-containing protein [Bacteroidales bacterium]